MRQCDGFSRTLLDESLSRCPYEAFERIGEEFYCYFHGRVVRGEITDTVVGSSLRKLSWNPRAKPKSRGAGPAEAAPMTDPIMQMLREEWAR